MHKSERPSTDWIFGKKRPNQTGTNVVLYAEMPLTGAEPAYWRMKNPDWVAATGPPTRLNVISSVGSLKACAPLWRELEDSARNCAALFQSYDWCSTWLLHALRSGHQCQPFIIAAHSGCKLILLWPMMLTQMAGLRVLRWLSDPWSQYGDVLADADHDAAGLMASVIELIRQSRAADAIWLRHVRADAAARPYLEACFDRIGQYSGAPFMDLTQFPTEAEYLARYDKPQRKRRRQIRRALEQKGALSFEVHGEGSAFSRGIADAIPQKRRWLSERGLHSRPIFSSWIESFLLALATDTTGRLKPVCSILKAGNHAISYEIGLRYRGRHYCFITAHDVTLTDESPARLHMDYAQRSALKEGHKTFDLMVPLAPHKTSWSSGHVAVGDYWLPLSPGGRMAGALFKTLRPAARALYHKTPEGLRRAACALIG
jgi:CelD/BcsL family acetyltransferase involved in cellulose biosynthesis